MTQTTSSAIDAALRILDLHQPYPMEAECCECKQCGPCPSHHFAGVVVERLRLAEKHLQAILSPDTPSGKCCVDSPCCTCAYEAERDHVVAALAALVGDTP